MLNFSILIDITKSLFGLNESSYDREMKRQKYTESIEWYRALNKVYFDILEVVFGNYRNSETLIAPDYGLSLTYVQLIETLTTAQEYKFIKDLPTFNFNDYINLNVNQEFMIKNYPKKRQEILDYRAKIEQLFYLENKGVEGNLDKYFEKDLEYYDDLIHKHKNKRGFKKEILEKLTLKFSQHKSKKKSVYKILEVHKGDWVNKRIIENEVDIKYDDFRAIIYQLRQDIISQKKIDQLRIDNNDRKGEYKLTILA